MKPKNRCGCDAWVVERDHWFYDNHFCEDGVRVEPWTKVKNKIETEREIAEKIHALMLEDGITPPKLGCPYGEALKIIYDYISFLKGGKNADGNI